MGFLRDNETEILIRERDLVIAVLALHHSCITGARLSQVPCSMTSLKLVYRYIIEPSTDIVFLTVNLFLFSHSHSIHHKHINGTFQSL